MKTRRQIAEQIHDEILEEIIRVNAEIELHRSNQNEKDKSKLIVRRSELELKLSLLEKHESLN